jgi:hypothetical protein
MLLRAIDRVLTHQALITGSVEDALSGLPTPAPPEITLYYQPPPGEEARPYPLTPRRYHDGLFVFAGDPTTAFPVLEAGESLDLRLVARAAGYQEQTLDFSLSAEVLTPVEAIRRIDERDVAVQVLQAPLAHHTLALLPEPVHLGGRVVDADDPAMPVAGAEVQLTTPAGASTITDEDGFFVLEMPVVSEVTITVSHADFDDLIETIRLDYRQPVNQQSFFLNRVESS